MRWFDKLKLTFALLIIVVGILPVVAEVTIEECVEKARGNYPLIKKYGLLKSLKEVNLSEINKNWLPKIDVYGQLTAQNVVPSYPEALSRVLQQMGQDVNGLSRLQYKVGVDLNQTIWDGGLSKVNREMVKSRTDVANASLDVELYAVRESVESIYFAILLSDVQIEQSELTSNLLEANLEKLRSMVRNGVAMQSDCDMVEAQLLTLRQNIDNARYARDGFVRVMELYVGEKLSGNSFAVPDRLSIEDVGMDRPELRLFEKRELSNSISDKITQASLLPKVGFFAQAYYGYPGYDYFKSMMQRTLTFNVMAGVKVSWNIDSFYHKKNRIHKTSLNKSDIENERELFLFNNKLASTRQRSAIEGLGKVMEEDQKIVSLRTRVRKAAESQLENGVIDATALLTKITDENAACLTARLHDIQYLQEIYKLKYILNK